MGRPMIPREPNLFLVATCRNHSPSARPGRLFSLPPGSTQHTRISDSAWAEFSTDMTWNPSQINQPLKVNTYHSWLTAPRLPSKLSAAFKAGGTRPSRMGTGTCIRLPAQRSTLHL